MLFRSLLAIRSDSESERGVAGGGPPVRSASMAAAGSLNADYERRPFWHASMTPQPDRSGRELPDSADVVAIGGGYAGINAARELARRGVAVTLLEAHTLGWGASTRNGGIVHAEAYVDTVRAEIGRASCRERV